jgi:adenylate cyclase
MKKKFPLPIILTAIIIVIGLELIQLTNIGTSKTIFHFSLMESIEFAFSFFFGLIAGFMITEFLFDTYFYTKNIKTPVFLLKKTLVQAFLMTLFAFLISEVLFPIYILNVSLDELFAESPPLEYVHYFLILYLVTYVVALVFNFFNELKRRFGLATAYNLIVGKYHTPVQEEFIFLFIDLKNSTNTCHALGDVKYLQLIQRVFFEIADPIMAAGGDIYQYAGDEVIIYWKPEDPENYNKAIRCFFAINELLEDNSSSYKRDFSITPQFYGAIHKGPVLTAELGRLKVLIEHRGLALNITGRILEFVKASGLSLVISSDKYPSDAHKAAYIIKQYENIQLRSVKDKMTLYSIETA